MLDKILFTWFYSLQKSAREANMKLNAQTVTQKDLVDTGRTLNVLCAFSLRPEFTEECST